MNQKANIIKTLHNIRLEITGIDFMIDNCISDVINNSNTDEVANPTIVKKIKNSLYQVRSDYGMPNGLLKSRNGDTIEDPTINNYIYKDNRKILNMLGCVYIQDYSIYKLDYYLAQRALCIRLIRYIKIGWLSDMHLHYINKLAKYKSFILNSLKNAIQKGHKLYNI